MQKNICGGMRCEKVCLFWDDAFAGCQPLRLRKACCPGCNESTHNSTYNSAYNSTYNSAYNNTYYCANNSAHYRTNHSTDYCADNVAHAATPFTFVHQGRFPRSNDPILQ